MANHGAGSKFVSVNLNKSYGQRTNVGPNRVLRSNAHNGGAGAGSGGGVQGGGMVLLSRDRSRGSMVGVQKSVPKLSVPPPLNLPSLRKEHERLDSSASGGGTGGANSVSGARPSSSGIGWTKPNNFSASVDGDNMFLGVKTGVDNGGNPITVDNGVARNGSNVYMPPSARPLGTPQMGATRNYPTTVEKAAVLRGEDFPSLQQATLPMSSGSTNNKQRYNSLHPKQNQKVSEEARSRPIVETSQSSHASVGREVEKSPKKVEYFPSPLPVVRLNHTSDWADDERDTRHSLHLERDKDRDHGFARNELSWDRDFDFHRVGVMPRKPVHDPSPREVVKTNPYVRDIRTPSREVQDGNSWRASRQEEDGFGARDDTGSDRNGFGTRSFTMSRETYRDSNKYGQATHQAGNRARESFNGRGSEFNRHSGLDQPNRYTDDFFQRRSGPTKTSYSLGSKGLPINDPILDFGREKRLLSGKQYVEDPFLKDDGCDPLTGNLVGVLKKKKDVVKQVDFHDPVRESFEAELERVQKIQEQERQRVIEEQARALELVRKEEEERQRVVREEEERQRRLEDEAREAAWRAEEERLENIRRAEEQKIAREEERRRIALEEERRKEAAKQKLVELEARISARRLAESTLKDDKEKDAVRGGVDVVDWEDGEKMVERITSSASSDSSSMNRSFEMSSSRNHFMRDGDSAFQERGKPSNQWKRDVFENGNTSNYFFQDQENNDYRSPRQDVFGATRKEFFGSPGVISKRTFPNGGIPEPHLGDDFRHPKGAHGWSYPGDGDHYNRNSEIDSEFHDNSSAKLNGMGWGQNRSRGSPHTSYSEKQYDNSETDGFPSFGRSRHSMRQPRVLPPPSLASMHKNNFRPEIERPRPSAILDSEMRYHAASRSSEPIMQTGEYDSNFQGQRLLNAHGENTASHDRNEERATTPRCDSQSSLSVSSPPSSPSHLSHDELEDLATSPVLPAPSKGEEVSVSDNGNKMAVSGYVSTEEDEEWSIENIQDLPEQEEYDEEEEGYLEEDELHDENIELPKELEVLNMEEKDSSGGKITEVGGPISDDLEKKTLNGDMAVETQQVSIGTSEEPGSLVVTENTFQSDCKSPILSVGIETSNKIIWEAEKALLDLVIEPASATVPCILDCVEVASVPSSPSQQSHAVSVNMAVPSPIMSTTVSTSQSQGEAPVKLQFGLFSGPSLIPSPVQAIQIGSIQMPLHLHHQVGPSPHQVHHSSQPPFFQFGQLRYTSPISQGVLPLAPHQPMSFVQPPLRPHFSMNHNQDTCNQNQLVKDVVPPVSMDNRSDHSRQKRSLPSESKIVFESNSQVDQGHHYMNAKKNYRSNLPVESATSQFISRAPGPVSGNRGKKYVYAVKNSGSRSSGPHSESCHTDFNVYRQRPRQKVQRTEFRVRENVDNKQKEGLILSERSNTGLANSHAASESKIEKRLENEAPMKKLTSSSLGISHSEVDVDAPLQSGVVRIFNQPGIEAASDEDDFIEVRSKRQMLNDRREQRERENRAISRAVKAPRKHRLVGQNNTVSTTSSKISTSGEATNRNRYKSVTTNVGLGLANVEGSSRFATSVVVSQPLAPIGTPSGNSDSHTIKTLQGGTKLGQTLSFENHNAVLDRVPTSLGPWGNARINQQVMSLTQTQLDEAMKPARFDTHVPSIGDHNNAVMESNMASSSSLLTHETTFSSTSSPLNSLLAGERIQFGAVTSPTILPLGSRAVLNGNSNDQKMSGIEGGCSLFFEKEKHHDEICTHLEDTEAEAAASAIAVAAISSDEINGNVSVSENKSFGVAIIEGLASEGGQGSMHLASQSRGEESSLAVSLPADLSIETPTLSLWPSLQSPQHSSSQMLSHFPGGPPSHFPCYEMNHPMLGGPIFAFGPQDEAAETQSQSQKGSSGPPGAWHSGVDSFYGPPAGFAGSFISPSGGIPGPPHMVVYNHFTPVGQFGQVGLSFMGTTYVPSGKQPDWKHNPTSSMGGEGDINDLNASSMQQQRNPPTMPPPIQHLAPGSPILPLASPLAMFDMSPFQSSTDIPIQARWSHVPHSPLHSVPLSVPLQQQQESGIASNPHLNHGLSVDHQSTGNMFHEPRSSVSLDTVVQLPHELGLLDSRIPATKPSSYNSTNGNNSKGAITKSSSRNAVVSSGENNSNISNSSNSNRSMGSSGLKTRSIPVQQYLHPTGYTDQRGGEWQSQHRRPGYQGRNNQPGIDKKTTSVKVKQIYVPKPNPSGTSSAF
ncbi:hypothetical protein GIB67_017628 [Kingdonia uniflora]|uniref:Uncharacterized protein n=1 Tax=Kingdonia uniflora TaxID=39325 RepID=A0A7J7LNB2_9MAGN|nr:hypothetical protein GIB67_017628 [Kingdonia uniflora]